jgi:hypothetical protein
MQQPMIIAESIPYPPAHGDGIGDDPDLFDLCLDGQNPDAISDFVPGIHDYFDFTPIEESVSRAHAAGIRQNLSLRLEDDAKFSKRAE